MQKRASRKQFQQRLDEMITTLREEIMSGQREVGKFLPAESELEKMFHLSNNSVRKGLDVLVKEGLLEKIPRVGNRVVRSAPQQQTVVRFGMQSTIEREADMERLIAEFHKAFPRIQIQTVAIPNEGYSRFVRECMEADMLDVCTINSNNFQDIVESGNSRLLEPLDERSGYYPFLSEPFRCEGQLLMQPIFFSPVILCYNKNHFREAGLLEPDSSWTWDDLFEAAKRLAVGNKRYGFYFHLLMRNRWPVFLLQSGVSFGEADFDRRALIGGLDICRKLLAMPDVFPVMLSASDADAEELFLKQQVSIIMTTYFGLNELADADFPFDVAPLPRYREFRTLMTVIGVAVNRNSRVKEAAKHFVDFLSSYDAQLLIRKHTLSIPADRRAAEWQGGESRYRPPRFHMYREIIPTFCLPKDLGLSSKQLSAIRKEVKLFWSGLSDEETLLARIEQALADGKGSGSGAALAGIDR
jgi:multiple sugar transport system substrate-binding protein